MRILLDVFQQSDLQPYLKQRLSPSENVDVNSDDDLMTYIRNEASTVYHPTSTCSIGKVVDPSLRVMGLEGLSVIDASVMPYVVSGNTNAATIMLAEKGADLLLEARAP